MGACSAASLGFVVESGVSMVCKDHFYGEINNIIILICGNVIKELYDGCGSVFSGC